MRRSQLASPVWVYTGMVLIATVGCVMMTFPDERLTPQTPITAAILIIALFLSNGLAYRSKNFVTRTMARQMLSLAGNSRPEDAELDRAQQDIMRSSWILFLGLIPAVGLLIYELAG